MNDPFFDFPGAGTEIERFCLQNDITPRMKYRIHLAFEELITSLLRPVLEHVPLLITVEYSGKDDIAEVTASYGGEKFDPSVHGDDLAYKVLKGIVNSYSYEYDSKEEQPNTVKVNI